MSDTFPHQKKTTKKSNKFRKFIKKISNDKSDLSFEFSALRKKKSFTKRKNQAFSAKCEISKEKRKSGK
jgi:hypothetical protein